MYVVEHTHTSSDPFFATNDGRSTISEEKKNNALAKKNCLLPLLNSNTFDSTISKNFIDDNLKIKIKTKNICTSTYFW